MLNAREEDPDEDEQEEEADEEVDEEEQDNKKDKKGKKVRGKRGSTTTRTDDDDDSPANIMDEGFSESEVELQSSRGRTGQRNTIGTTQDDDDVLTQRTKTVIDDSTASESSVSTGLLIALPCTALHYTTLHRPSIATTRTWACHALTTLRAQVLCIRQVGLQWCDAVAATQQDPPSRQAAQLHSAED